MCAVCACLIFRFSSLCVLYMYNVYMVARTCFHFPTKFCCIFMCLLFKYIYIRGVTKKKGKRGHVGIIIITPEWDKCTMFFKVWCQYPLIYTKCNILFVSTLLQILGSVILAWMTGFAKKSDSHRLTSYSRMFVLMGPLELLTNSARKKPTWTSVVHHLRYWLCKDKRTRDLQWTNQIGYPKCIQIDSHNVRNVQTKFNQKHFIHTLVCVFNVSQIVA